MFCWPQPNPAVAWYERINPSSLDSGALGTGICIVFCRPCFPACRVSARMGRCIMYVSSSRGRPSCGLPWGMRRALYAAAVVLALPFGGCASNSAQTSAHTAHSWPGNPARVAGYTAHAERPAPRVHTEADGLEGQMHPYRRETQEPDDPSEPFSPNYGRSQISQADETYGDAAGYANDQPAQGYLKRAYAAY